MSTSLIRDEDRKGFLLTRFWNAGVRYQITAGHFIGYVQLTEEQARFLVEVLTADFVEPKP
jgi:hypothetical protein